MHAKSTAAYKPTVTLTSHRGWYRVQSGTTPSVYYETSANSCTCPARKPCRHMRFVRSLNVAFFVKKEAAALRPLTPLEPVVVPMTAGAPSGIVRPVRGNLYAGLDAEIAEAERFLEIERQALADAHPQSDAYAPLLRAVDQAERAVAALNYSAIRAA
jgi:hypothetical protein